MCQRWGRLIFNPPRRINPRALWTAHMPKRHIAKRPSCARGWRHGGVLKRTLVREVQVNWWVTSWERERKRGGTHTHAQRLPFPEADQSLNEVGGSLDAGSLSAADVEMLAAVQMTPDRASRRHAQWITPALGSRHTGRQTRVHRPASGTFTLGELNNNNKKNPGEIGRTALFMNEPPLISRWVVHPFSVSTACSAAQPCAG